MNKLKDLLLYFSLPYVVAVSGIYNFSYWSQFDINIYPYLEVQDVIKGFIYPLTKSIYIVLIYGIVSFYLTPPLEIVIEKIPEKQRKNGTGLTLFAIFSFILTFEFKLRDTIILKSYIFNGILLIAAAAILPPLIMFFDFGSFIIKDIRIRVFLFMFILITFCSAYVIGITSSVEIYDNKYYDYTYSNFDKPFIKSNQILKYKYIGSAGDYYFFLSMNNKLRYIINKEELKNLRLLRYESAPKFWDIVRNGGITYDKKR